jgi:hypothetical protein
MFNFGILINKFYDIFNKQQTIFEIILNLSFVLILFIIAFIFYWDSINRSVINTSRCKAIIKNDDSAYTVNFYSDKDTRKNKLYSISYDNTRNHNVKITCEGVCSKSSGDAGVQKKNINIPYFDYKEQKIDGSYTKICYCDASHNLVLDGATTYDNHKNLDMDGDQFLSDYYKTFYTNMPANPTTYSSKLYFPA